ncbi:hypothetical protein BACCIP111895_01969 [Neobacillus rhizosphaerae]|uniref:PD-(D/E)XK motif protein n=1 Tax=Neobacillus rhizosphaerae TaxID=2880965 RepID=A0ABN8KR28_9BACI|nr:PD-(D/E)XK motif protein [Neobacillus rhizosphaerae]CAH2714793.1 hypothetical protein BACCIP111895_01969 [Neobacillus rhizosphaerae]
MISNETLLAKWNKLAIHNNSFVRIDAEHPLEWHIGYENINQKSLLLITEFQPETTTSSKSIIVTQGQRADSKWALSFRLIRGEQEDVFIRLCCDMVESSRNQNNDINGLEFVIQRYSQWAKLMEVQPSGFLNDAQQKGLLGEIHYLQQAISNGIPLLEAVNGWIGPDGADQDFIFSDGWHEVKALGIGRKTVNISSLEQLDAQLPGELILYFIDKTAQNSPNAFTLNSKISQVRGSLSASYSALELFNDKLLRCGYIELPEYAKQYYRLSGVKMFRVDENFPRLIKDNVPTGVVASVYQLSIQALEDWKIN